MITQTIPDTWSVHEPNQPPVEGIAVWKYRWGQFVNPFLNTSLWMWKCERCGTATTTKPECEHIEKVKDYENEAKRTETEQALAERTKGKE